MLGKARHLHFEAIAIPVFFRMLVIQLPLLAYEAYLRLMNWCFT